MIDLRIVAATAGTAFGTWPFFQGPSGVGGTTAAAVMAVVTIAITAPLAFVGWNGSVSNEPSWMLLILGGTIQTVGIVAMALLANTSPAADLPRYMAFGFVVNACVPVVWFFASNLRNLTKLELLDVVGFAAAIIAAYCLGRPR